MTKRREEWIGYGERDGKAECEGVGGEIFTGDASPVRLKDSHDKIVLRLAKTILAIKEKRRKTEEETRG